MNVIEYLKENGFQKLSDEYGIRIKVFVDSNKNVLYVLNYSGLLPHIDLKFNNIVKECRGLILDSKFNVVSRSFDRFFNHCELSKEQLQKFEFDRNFTTRFEVREKLDGSLIKIYHHDGVWYVSTRQTAFAEQNVVSPNKPNATFKNCVFKALNVEDEKSFQKTCDLFFAKDTTYIFELTSPINRVVTSYDEYSLWYLGCRHNRSGLYDPHKSISGVHVKYPTVYTFSSLEECLNSALELPFDQEGYVIYEKASGIPLLKVKSPSYVRAHNNIGQGSQMSQKQIVRLIALGEHEEFLSHFPDKRSEFEPLIKKIDQYLKIASDYFKTCNEMHRDNEERQFIDKMKDFTYGWIAIRARKSKQSFMAAYNALNVERKIYFILKKVLPPEMIMTVGVSGSGKTSFANEFKEKYGYVNINRDDAREWLNPSFKSGGKKKHRMSRADEKKVSEHCEKIWNQAKSLRQNVIISDCNLKEIYQKIWEKRAHDSGYVFIKKYFPITIEEAWKNDLQRSRSVGRDVIVDQYEKWLKLTKRRQYRPNTEMPKAILCDVDGTIAMALHRNMFEFSKVATDEPRTDIIDMVMAWADSKKYQIIFLSGRDKRCFEATQHWIEKWVGVEVGENNLFMREIGDFRKDRVIKEEIFWSHIAKNYNVVAVVDDRPQVIRMWHDIGIENVISVQKGYKEF